MAGERKQQILETQLKCWKRQSVKKSQPPPQPQNWAYLKLRSIDTFNKAQMFEGLISFIEETIFGLINKINTEETDGYRQIQRITTMLLAFGEKNPGMTRVLISDTQRSTKMKNCNFVLTNSMTALITLKQSLKISVIPTSGKKVMPEAQANLLICYVIGRWQQFAKSGFKRKPLLASVQVSYLTN